MRSVLLATATKPSGHCSDAKPMTVQTVVLACQYKQWVVVLLSVSTPEQQVG